ncbi:MAG TPA: hypothetical protein VHX66_09885 [Solirubrobacteraceae bacterium]|jgi:hypothetical protein|nr:hypothetical protein [Solirubrobacteraceae bacterium]
MGSAQRAAERYGGRARQPGPLWALGALVLATAALAGCGGGSRYPAYLPKRTLDVSVDRPLSGAASKPALTVEGLAVDVKARAFHVTITVSGPIVPGEGLPEQPPSTTCTWTVTMSNASGVVPISLKDFHAVNQFGAFTVPKFVPGEHRPPSVLRPGHAVRFQLRAYQLVGQGTMQWAPDRRHPVAIWDYEVEND